MDDLDLSRIRRKVEGARLLAWDEAQDLLAAHDALFDECARLTAEVMALRGQLKRARAVACGLEAEFGQPKFTTDAFRVDL